MIYNTDKGDVMIAKINALGTLNKETELSFTAYSNDWASTQIMRVGKGAKVRYSIWSRSSAKLVTIYAKEVTDTADYNKYIYQRNNADNTNTATLYEGVFNVEYDGWLMCFGLADKENSVTLVEEMRIELERPLSAEPTEYSRVQQFSFGEPALMFKSIGDSDSITNYIGYGTVVNVSGNKNYIYYEGSPSGSYPNTPGYLCMAYTTDGENWTQGLPDSHEVIVQGMPNAVLPDLITAPCVVKVPDSDKPFRLIANKAPRNSALSYKMYIWKSANGVDWTDERLLLDIRSDTQPSVIVRGSVLKIYMRLRDYTKSYIRVNAIMYTDLDGNIIAPPTAFVGLGFYNPAALPIDNNREIMLPTFFDVSNDKNWYDSFIVQDEQLWHIDNNVNELMDDTDRWGTINPGWLFIDGQPYITYTQRKYSHNGTSPRSSNPVIEMRCAPIVWITNGVSEPHTEI